MARTASKSLTEGGAVLARDGETDGPVGTRYSNVAEVLRTEIAARQFEVGAKLPTEFDLCQRFGVSRSTVRQALAELESSGLVKRRQGSGTTVVAREPALRYSLAVSSEADIMRYASETAFEIFEFAAQVSASESRRLRLGSPSEWRLWRGLRRATAGGVPIGIASVYIPTLYLEHMRKLERVPQGAIFDYLARANGLSVTVIEQEISATVVDQAESERLQTPVGMPALSIVRRYASSQSVIEVAETIYPSDRFRYDLRLERDDSGRPPR